MQALRAFFPRRATLGVPVQSILRVRSLSSDPTSRDLRVEHLQGQHEGITVFAINRAAAKNSLGRTLMTQLAEGVSSVIHDRSVRVVILRSDVPGMFCAGADLKERATMKEEEVGPMVAKGRRLISDLSNLPKPVISALDGFALGGGLEVALATDIRVAADNATMGLVETRLAIIPGGGGTQRLPRLVGIGKAKELIFTAKVLTGVEAKEIGLVEHVVPQNGAGDAAYQKALEIATDITSKGPIAVAMAKHAIDNGMQTDLNTGMKVEESCYAQVIPTADRVEALKAFREKRKPVFEGK